MVSVRHRAKFHSGNISWWRPWKIFSLSHVQCKSGNILKWCKLEMLLLQTT